MPSSSHARYSVDELPPQRLLALIVSASVAIGLPMLLAYNSPPSSTFLNQAAALIGWGCWLTLLTLWLGVQKATPRGTMASRAPSRGGLVALQLSLALLFAAAAASPFWTSLPWPLALSSMGLIAAAALAVQAGAATQRHGTALAAFHAFCIGMVVAGILSAAVGILQVAAPDWPDGEWIARTYLVGRAVGNMRQPNHLSSLLLWAIIAVVWLGESQVLNRWASTGLALLFVFVVVLSGSRTGTVSVCLLAVWGLLDRRLSRHARISLGLAPVAYFAFLFGTAAWAEMSHHAFGAEARFSGEGDISSSRFGIWKNTLSLIAMHPWLGVGFGEFNFAWTLTPFPGRPVAFFDHTHNLLLQFAVELGLPLAALVLALMLWALYQAVRGAIAAAKDADPAQAPLRRAALVMVLMIGVHSQLEYPLWYAYFLLPAAFVFGLCLAPSPTAAESRAAPREAAPAPGAARPIWLVAASVLMTLGGIASVFDYWRVVTIFEPGDTTASLPERIENGQHSVLFAHHADYAAATTAAHPGDALPAFAGASHYLLDSRLMQAWATALNESGDTDRARYVAQRLKEFRNEQSEAFFAPCTEPTEPGVPLPFQCQMPERAWRYEDFR